MVLFFLVSIYKKIPPPFIFNLLHVEVLAYYCNNQIAYVGGHQTIIPFLSEDACYVIDYVLLDIIGEHISN